MALGERELAVVLQATVEHASQRLVEQGSFLPFGVRAKLDGEVEFIEFLDVGGQPLEALQSQLVATLGEEVKAGSLLGAGFVATVALPEEGEFSTAIAVQLESEDFCRLVVVPYRRDGDEVVTGTMSPQAAKPLVYTS